MRESKKISKRHSFPGRIIFDPTRPNQFTLIHFFNGLLVSFLFFFLTQIKFFYNETYIRLQKLTENYKISKSNSPKKKNNEV